jgi:hypothetical protein
MYHFKLNGVECSCETAIELVVATSIDRVELGQHHPLGCSKPKKTEDSWICETSWEGDAGDKLNELIEKKKGVRATSNRKGHGVIKLSKGNSSIPHSEMEEFHDLKSDQAKCKHTLEPSHCSVIEKLPYVESATWAITKKIAKKLGRTDILQLRTDLYYRKKMGK